MSGPQVYVDGTPLSMLGWWGDLEVVDRWPGGSWSLSWRMALRPDQKPPVLATRRAVVEAKVGPTVMWSGRLADPDWGEGAFTADGMCREAETAVALDAGVATNNVGAALLGAILRGEMSAWKTFNAFPNPTDEPATDLNRISDLLDASVDTLGERWAVTPGGWLYHQVDPTTPTYYVLPGIEGLGVTTDRQVTRLHAQYVTKSLGTATVSAGAAGGGVERYIDLMDQGPLTSTQAQSIVNGIFNKSGGKAQFSSGIEVTYGQVVNEAGAAVGLANLTSGLMYRVMGMRDPRNPAIPYTEFVAGERSWRVNDGTVQLNPVNMAAASFEQVVEEAGGKVNF